MISALLLFFGYFNIPSSLLVGQLTPIPHPPPQFGATFSPTGTDFTNWRFSILISTAVSLPTFLHLHKPSFVLA